MLIEVHYGNGLVLVANGNCRVNRKILSWLFKIRFTSICYLVSGFRELYSKTVLFITNDSNRSLLIKHRRTISSSIIENKGCVSWQTSFSISFSLCFNTNRRFISFASPYWRLIEFPCIFFSRRWNIYSLIEWSNIDHSWIFSKVKTSNILINNNDYGNDDNNEDNIN